MSIYDRDYMRPNAKPPLTVSARIPRKSESGPSLPLWNRLLFFLWRIFHPRRHGA